MTFNGASNPTKLDFEYDRDCDWLPMFRGATFGKLEDITFRPKSEQIDDPLEAFEKVALAASVQNTVTEFRLHTSRSWNPNYSSLLPFTQLTDIIIEFSCDDGGRYYYEDGTSDAKAAIPCTGRFTVPRSPHRRHSQGIRGPRQSLLGSPYPLRTFSSGYP